MSESERDQETAARAPATNELDALRAVIAALQPLSDEARRRILEAASTFLNVDVPLRKSPALGPVSLPQGPAAHAPFSENSPMSPKEFILEKQPRTDVERVACLAYYLTHYRSTPHFKTADLSVLNMEAAQPKFSNAAYATNNAVKAGFLVASTKGQRQLSAFGERFVRALPDRDAARIALESLRRRGRSRRAKGTQNSNEE